MGFLRIGYAESAELQTTAISQKVTSTILMTQAQAEELKNLLAKRGISIGLITTAHREGDEHSYSISVDSYVSRDILTAREIISDYEKNLSSEQKYIGPPTH